MNFSDLTKMLNSVQVEDVIYSSAFLIAIFLMRFIFLWSLRKMGKLHDATRSFVNWFVFYAILLFLLLYFGESKWMFSSIVTIGKVDVTLSLIIIAIFIITLANRLSKIITTVLLPGIYGRYQLDRGLQYTFDRFIHYAIMVFAIIISLSTVGIDLSALTVFAGIISVGIGFGMQNIASNFISGIILLFERPIKVGDRVIVDDVIGDIQKINMRATVIKTLNNEHIIVPNSYFLEEKVVNRSYSDPRLRLVIPVGVAYGSDVEKVRDLLLEVAEDEAKASPIVLRTPEPFVNFVGFGESSLDFELFVWIAHGKDFIKITSNLNFRINKILNEHAIEIPFPQRDLHIRSVEQSLLAKQNAQSE